MRLIGLAVVLALSLVLVPLAAGGQPATQPSGKVPTIGYLSWGDRPGPLHEAFRQGLRDFGYDEDRKKLVLHSTARRYGRRFSNRLPISARNIGTGTCKPQAC
jgi:hypothetical protein